MAHTCPECDQVCFCNGDIDDCVMDTEETFENCTHYLECEQETEDGGEFYTPPSRESSIINTMRRGKNNGTDSLCF